MTFMKGDAPMVKGTPIGAWFAAGALVLTALAGCTGDDGPESDGGREGKNADKAAEAAKAAFVGSFVGEVEGTKAFVAVVAAPAQEGQDSGAVQVYVSDGRGLSELFSGPISDGGFTAESDDGDAEAEGTLNGDSVTGTVALPDGTTTSYEASPPSGGAGLYELTVASGGKLSGASANGLAVRGEIKLAKRGTGTLRLVDGKRLRFVLKRKRAGEVSHLRAGQARLIVLPDGGLRGVAKGRTSNGGNADFFIRSV